MNSINSIKRKLLAASIVILSLMIFTEYSWATNLLPWVRFGGTYQVTAGIGAGSLTLNATVKEMDYENGQVWTANVPGVETIYGARVVLSGAIRTGNYSFNGNPAIPDDVTLSIVSSDGYVYFTSILVDSVFVQQGAYFVWLNQYLNANDPATLNLHNIILRPNGDDGLHPSRYISELAAYLGSTNVSGLKMQLFVPSSGNFTTNASGSISYGLIDGLQSLKPPSGLGATAISSSQINLSWTDNSNNETGFKLERKTGAGGTYSQIAIVGANVITYSDTGLTAGTTYYYRVRAYNSFGDSGYSNEANATTIAIAPTATINPATNINGNSVTLNGTVNPNGSETIVYFEWWTDINNKNNTPSQFIGSGTSNVNVTANLTGLLPNTIYYYRVVATNAGGTSNGSDMSLTTPPITSTIISPVNGSTISKPDVMVKGTVSNTTGNETGVTVNGIAMTAYGNQFVANNVPLTEGSNTITVTATDTAGNTATTSITVNAITTGNYIRITANPESGIAPLEVTLKIDGSFSITNSTITYTGPAQPETLSSSADEYRVRMTVEGIYYFTANVTGPDSNVYQDTVAVVVLNATQLDALLRAKWEAIRSAMISGDTELALSYFVEGSKDRYRQTFTEIGNEIKDRFAEIVALEIYTVDDHVAQCGAVRIEPGGTYTYPVTFVKDENGIWNMMGF